MPVDARTGDYPTEPWAEGTRAYHVAVRVAPQPAGAHQMVARVHVLVAGEAVASARVLAEWSDDVTRTAPIDEAVGHYPRPGPRTGDGGGRSADPATAERDLGHALRRAAERGDDHHRALVASLVDLDDTDTLGLRRTAARSDDDVEAGPR